MNTNMPTRHIGIPQPRSRSHRSLNAPGVSAAGRAPSTNQATIAFASQFAIPPSYGSACIADDRNLNNPRVQILSSQSTFASFSIPRLVLQFTAS